jgi:UDP-N-acetylmuramoyl-L-alanyl-D-glutamate--2,6-diaminopimelate ligase
VITSLCHDSREALAGSLFFCLKGERSDGHLHAKEAVERGAAALVCERHLELGVPEVLVKAGRARAAMAALAAAYYGMPAEKLRIVGVTGTNGKTTVTYLLKSIFEQHGWPTAVLGTIGGARTTPESDVVQKALAGEVAKGRVAVAMEVSSHALVQERVQGLVFAAAVFTNLSHEHLDYHKTMDAYFQAKAALFAPGIANLGVVNRGDPWGRRLIALGAIPMVSYALEDASRTRLRATGSRFCWRGVEMRLAMPGSFNVENALAAATTASAIGVPDEVIAAGLRTAQPVPGRFQEVDEGQPFSVVVDYAHTPAGLQRAGETARDLSSGRLIIVFGCGGDRDRSKRGPMGEAASMLADVVVLTSDNPRFEDPMAIITDIVGGVIGRSELIVEPDRELAIDRALSIALPGDMVLVAGRGHENAQDIAGRSLPFDDVAVVRELLRRGRDGRG